MKKLPNLARSSTKCGLTSVEVLVILVVAVIAVLLFGIDTAPNRAYPKAMFDSARLFVGQTSARSLDAYQVDMKEFPSSTEGLAALFKAPVGKEAKWRGPYLDEPNGQPPLDPWKEPYVYRQPGTHNKDGYDLFSKGQDGIADTADDIGNW